MNEKNERNYKKLKEAILQINSIEPVRNLMFKDLANSVSKEVLEAVFNGSSLFEDLTQDEKIAISKKVFNFTKDNDLNPVELGLIDNETEDDSSNISNSYYNYNFKKQFSEEYSENTARVVMALFKKTADDEKSLGKDIYEFSKEEFRQMLFNLKLKTIRSLQNYVSTLERYINFAYKHGKIKYRINVASAFSGKDNIEEFLAPEAEDMIFSKEDIMEMAMDTQNAQDGVILALLFEGVSKNNDFEELINLERKDIDFENLTITLPNRKIKVSTETMILIKDALEDDLYYSINGDRVRKYKIAEGENVLRGLRGKNKIRPQHIRERLLRLADFYGYDLLNATNVSYSGQIYFAEELLKGKIDIDTVVDKVIERFNIPKNHSSQFYVKTRIQRYL